MLRIGSRLPDGVPEALVRDLSPMARQIRATLPTVAARALGGAPEKTLRSLGAALRRDWPDARIAGLVRARGSQVLERSDRDWAPLRRALGRDARRIDRRQGELPDGRDLLARWSRISTDRIKSVRDSVVPGLRRDILHAIEHDWTPEQLARVWVKRQIPLEWGTLEGRAKVIAHTELRTLQAEIQRERSTAVGVREFRWRTQGDDLVRDEHEELEDTVHAWDTPPSIGLPGQTPNCRCWAESIVTDELLASLGIAALAA